MDTGFLVNNIYTFMLVFMRVVAIIMILPIFGSRNISGKIKLSLCLMLALILLPIVSDKFGPMPSNVWEVFFAVASEVFVGAIIGLTARLIMTSLQTAGTVLSFQVGLSFAQSVDPSQGIQGAVMGSFLNMLGAVFILGLDLHHLFFIAIHDSFILFEPGKGLAIESFVQLGVDTIAKSFVVGVKIASPFMVFGLIFYFGIGILTKLMPQIQIFFIAMPANIFIGFCLMIVVMSTLLMFFSDHFKDVMMNFIL